MVCVVGPSEPSLFDQAAIANSNAAARLHTNKIPAFLLGAAYLPSLRKQDTMSWCWVHESFAPPPPAPQQPAPDPDEPSEDEYDRFNAFQAVHAAMESWMARPCTRNSFEPTVFGAADDAHGDNLHLRLRRARAANGELGVHLIRISIPPACRRRGCATRLLDAVLREARKARFAYVIVEFVVSAAMDALMRRRAEFLPLSDPPDSYIARLN